MSNQAVAVRLKTLVVAKLPDPERVVFVGERLIGGGGGGGGGASNASALTFTPVAGTGYDISSTNTQDAVEEVASEGAQALAAEAATRASADSTNAAAITAEAATRSAADTTEASARASADSAEASARAAADALLIPLSQKAAASGVATLDSGGKIPQAQIPSFALVDYLGTSADQTAMLALPSADPGDWTIRLDTGTTWIVTGSPSSLIGNWTELAYPAAPVTSVAGRTGDVTLSSADITDAGTAITHDVPASGNAAAGEVVLGSDTRLTDTRTPTDNTVTTAKIVDGTILPADLADSGVTAAAYGSASAVGTFTVNAKGQLTAAASTSIAIAESAVSGLVTDLAGKQPLDTDLTQIAALTPTNDDIIQRKAGAWTNRTMAQLSADLVTAGTFGDLIDWNGVTTPSLTGLTTERIIIQTEDLVGAHANLLLPLASTVGEADIIKVVNQSTVQDGYSVVVSANNGSGDSMPEGVFGVSALVSAGCVAYFASDHSTHWRVLGQTPLYLDPNTAVADNITTAPTSSAVYGFVNDSIAALPEIAGGYRVRADEAGGIITIDRDYNRAAWDGSAGNYTADISNEYIAQTGTLSTHAILTLPAASSVPAGWDIEIADESGSVVPTAVIAIVPAGGDAILGGAWGSISIDQAYGGVKLRSNGVSRWGIVAARAAATATSTPAALLPALRARYQ